MLKRTDHRTDFGCTSVLVYWEQLWFSCSGLSSVTLQRKPVQVSLLQWFPQALLTSYLRPHLRERGMNLNTGNCMKWWSIHSQLKTLRNFPGKLHLSFITFCCITLPRDAVNIATSREYLTSANSSSLLEQLLQMSLVRNTFSFPK